MRQGGKREREEEREEERGRGDAGRERVRGGKTYMLATHIHTHTHTHTLRAEMVPCQIFSLLRILSGSDLQQMYYAYTHNVCLCVCMKDAT